LSKILRTKGAKFFIRVVIFLFFIFIFDRALFFVIQNLEVGFHKKENFKKKFVKFPKGTYSTLIMGSSRTYRGIHPLYLYQILGKKAFKVAKQAVGPKFNYFIYQEYKKLAGIPKIVVYGVDYFIFHLSSPLWYKRFFDNKDYRKDFYTPGLLLLVSNKPQIDSFFNNILNHFNESFIKKPILVKKRKYAIINKFVGFPKRGLLASEKPSHFKKHPYKPFPGKEGIYFLKLIEDLNMDGVVVILVILPDFIGTYETNYQKELFIQEIINLTEPFKNVFLYDYNSPEKFPLSDSEYFLDGGFGRANSHLSKEGARIFNRLLVKDLSKHYQ